MIFIEIDRLILRNFEPQDAEIMCDYRNNEKCSRYQRGQAKNLDEIVELTERRKNDAISADTPFMTAIAFKDTGEMVGEITVMPRGFTFFIGYTLSYRHQRKGYAFEAVSAIVQLLHANYPTMDFLSFTDTANTPSMNLLKKLGYTDLGYLAEIDSEVFGKWLRAETEEEYLPHLK